MATIDRPAGTVPLVGSFDDPADARETMIDLEAAGWDADAVHLIRSHDSVPTRSLRQAGDLDVAGTVAGRAVVGGVVLGLVGAALAVAAVLLAGVEPRGRAVLIAGLAGFLAAGALGAIWSAMWRLPVNAEALDTYTIDPKAIEPVHVEVLLHSDDDIDDVAAVFRRHHARSVERRAA